MKLETANQVTKSANTRVIMDAGKFRDDEYRRWCELLRIKLSKPCR